MANDETIAEIASELAGLVARLDDLILDVLREAVESGAEGRPVLERRLTRARNALERAGALLATE
ncbi:MAG: hypothetical protein ACRDV8_11115 [Acidimicrobiales bacterium]